MASGEPMVRILAVSDIHGTQSGFLAIHEFIKNYEPDILVMAGDITDFGPAEWARNLFDSIRIPLMVVNGNCDTGDVIQIIENHEAGLLNECKNVSGLNFLGIGYPFATDIRPDCDFDIIISHVPPRGCNDIVPGQNNRGDADFREFILKYRPRVILSGHIHESPGIAELDGITCINPGPAKDGRGALIDINKDDLNARLIHIS